MDAMQPAYLILLDFITAIFGEEYKLYIIYWWESQRERDH
jgi:hypothetical protein